MKQLLIAGAGLGGLAAAIGAGRAGWQARVFEQAAWLEEVGAGIQLGPNATRVLQAWGLLPALERVACFPDELRVLGAASGECIGALELGARCRERYGAPYATVHRADLQALLLDAAHAAGDVRVHLNATVDSHEDMGDAVQLSLADGARVEGDALLAADGLWSQLRQRLLGDGEPAVSGHVAYRALLPCDGLPQARLGARVTVWLGPRLHVVAYPVRAGACLNLVVIVEGGGAGDAADWSQPALAADLRQAMGETCAELRELTALPQEWRLWSLCDRRPLSGAHQMAQGRVALLGDAAHPMRPYLAQGAAMALEDAAALGQVLAMSELDVPLALRRYALNRWQRNARVQARSRRNGVIFHANGPLRWARDLAIRALGRGVLDVPWLYSG